MLMRRLWLRFMGTTHDAPDAQGAIREHCIVAAMACRRGSVAGAADALLIVWGQRVEAAVKIESIPWVVFGVWPKTPPGPATGVARGGVAQQHPLACAATPCCCGVHTSIAAQHALFGTRYHACVCDKTNSCG